MRYQMRYVDKTST
ncbi:23S rRNA methyltransferase attenuation leader peptide, partial [Streptococcus suis]|nr:23S rRNA methyltransferase attenuation leader peptide [Streptococcus suis]MCJ7481205.1 23S rRNA methyltransferase attenuation leader peptide [Streptococcus suis]